MLSCSSVFQGPKKVGALWREAGLSWKEFLPEGQDVAAFVAEQVCGWSSIWGWPVFHHLTHVLYLPLDCGLFWLQKVEYTLGEESEAPGQRLLSSEELSKQLEKLLKENSSNQQVFDWIEVRFSWYQESRIKEKFWCDDGGKISKFIGHSFFFFLHRPT